jgi:hypothetical protein
VAYEQWDLPALAERLGRLEESLRDVETLLRALEREVGGVTPNGPTVPIRKRLHELEGVRSAESAARAALAAAKAERAASSSESERRWWATAALLVTVLNVVVAVHPWS